MEKKYNLEFFTKWVDEFEWTFAKSYADKAPHEYLVAKKIPQEDRKIMIEFAKFIKTNGYSEKFYQSSFVYLNIGDKKYWTMDYPLYKTDLVNRCPIENTYGNKNT